MTNIILPHELPNALEHGPHNMRVLSLDCFDTLLWRDCYAPTDVFAGLPSVSTGQRIVGETRARKVQNTLRGGGEVGLAAIYDHAMPNACDTDRDVAITAELIAEADVCFGFEPTIELMAAAKAVGHQVIIVSDTYLNADQLLELIRRAAGDDVAGLIDRVFASSEAGISKSQGLLAKALKTMKCRADQMLHIGDNKSADYDGARALGVPALHLAQFQQVARQRFRFERTCQQIIGDATDEVRGLMPHRAMLSRDEPQSDDAAHALGLTVLGPVFHAYDQWLRHEACELEQERGGKVHWLFMLRDGHLPYIVHDAGGSTVSAARVEISRFTAIGASMSTRKAYIAQYAQEFGLTPMTLARQMLMEDDEIARVVGDPKTETEKVEASHRLRDELRKGQREKVTRRRSRARAERLIEHVRAQVNPQPGDTLMLVDLGYNGSAQDRIDAILSEAFKVHVAGRYLLLREMAATGLDKKGLIDDRHFDAELLEALCGNVAVIEQLATCELGSVIDFTDDGTPIRKASSVKGAQSDVRDRVQSGAVDYAKAAGAPPIVRTRWTHSDRALRDMAASVLIRFMFLPMPHELDVLKSFEHDVNLGSERMVGLFDEAHAHEGLRRRGLFYMKGSARMFLPAEIVHEDIHTRLSLFAQKRFALGLSYSDVAAKSVPIPAFYVSDHDSTQTTIHAQPTHDGFYTARLPVTEAMRAVGLQVGSAFEWLELVSITASRVDGLKGGDLNDARPSEVLAQFDKVKEHAIGILECTDPAAFVLVNRPAQREGDDQLMIEIVMRPLRRRAAIPAQATPVQTTHADGGQLATSTPPPSPSSNMKGAAA
ncbi:MAG: HAD family hydrolase [Erythrobacter sp.]